MTPHPELSTDDSGRTSTRRGLTLIECLAATVLMALVAIACVRVISGLDRPWIDSRDAPAAARGSLIAAAVADRIAREPAAFIPPAAEPLDPGPHRLEVSPEAIEKSIAGIDAPADAQTLADLTVILIASRAGEHQGSEAGAGRAAAARGAWLVVRCSGQTTVRHIVIPRRQTR